MPDTPASEVWVLLKERLHYDSDETTTSVMAVYADRADLDARVERIKKANAQYPARQVGENTWRLGPEDDEGFFGAQPVYLRATTARFHPTIEPAHAG